MDLADEHQPTGGTVPPGLGPLEALAGVERGHEFAGVGPVDAEFEDNVRRWRVVHLQPDRARLAGHGVARAGQAET